VTVNQSGEDEAGMGEKPPAQNSQDAAALLEVARAGGDHAAAAARRAAWLAERVDRGLAREALALTLRFEPLDLTPKLALARLAAEDGDLAKAVCAAEAVLAEAIDQAVRARAAFMLGEIARFQHDVVLARRRFEEAARIEDNILAANRGEPSATRWYARARGRLADLDADESAYDSAFVGAEGALALLRATAAAIGEQPILAADIADAEVRLAALELRSAQPVSARRRLGEAIGRYEALAVTEKDEPHWRAALADAWALAAEADYARGADDDARQAMDKALQARLRLAAHDSSEAWALAGLWRLRGALRSALGDVEAANDSFAQARALAEHLVKDSDQASAPSRFFVHTLLDEADHALRLQAVAPAQANADRARAIAEAFARTENTDPLWLSDAAACWDRLGEAARMAGAGEQARDAFSRAVEFWRLALGVAADRNSQFTNGLSASLIKLGDSARALSANAEARACFEECTNIRRSALDMTPEDRRAAHGLAVALERLGLAAMAQADRKSARAAWEEELALTDLIFATPGEPEALRFRAIVEGHLAGLGGTDASKHRAHALDNLQFLERLRTLDAAEIALRTRLSD
jgi:tetratricopeptide (TPR) repeat protein